MPGQLQRTREYVEDVFRQLDQQVTLPLRETALIRGGHYCGHRFSSDQLSAVWFFEEGQLKVYGGDHQVVQVCAVSSAEVRRAA